jgi:hypothetical protein
MAVDLKRPVDWPARVIGLTVFLIGIGLLVLVFVWANQTLSAPVTPPGQTINWGSMGTRLAWDLGRLVVLGFVASAIAGRGVQLYAVAGRAETSGRPLLE